MESGCVDLAWQAGINYFFSYDVNGFPDLPRFEGKSDGAESAPHV